MKKILILALCVFVVACSSTPIDYEGTAETDQNNGAYDAMSDTENNDTYDAMSDTENNDTYDAMSDDDGDDLNTIEDEELVSNDTFLEEDVDSNDNTEDVMADESNDNDESRLTLDVQTSGNDSNLTLAGRK